jgi:hypothetical protein
MDNTPTIHQIWLGDHPMPTQFTDTWNNIPGTSHHIHRTPFTTPLQNQTLYDSTTHKYNMKSDILRLEILERYGGVYLDTDIIRLCTDHVARTSFQEWTADGRLFLVQEKRGLVSNSFLLCHPGNSVISEFIAELVDVPAEGGVWQLTGPGRLTNFLLRKEYITNENPLLFGSTDKVVVLPHYIFNAGLDLTKTHFTRRIPDDEEYTKFVLSAKKNKDVQFVQRGNEIDSSLVLGIQMWMGGKATVYGKINSNSFHTVYQNVRRYKNNVLPAITARYT